MCTSVEQVSTRQTPHHRQNALGITNLRSNARPRSASSEMASETQAMIGDGGGIHREFDDGQQIAHQWQKTNSTTTNEDQDAEDDWYQRDAAAEDGDVDLEVTLDGNPDDGEPLCPPVAIDQDTDTCEDDEYQREDCEEPTSPRRPQTFHDKDGGCSFPRLANDDLESTLSPTSIYQLKLQSTPSGDCTTETPADTTPTGLSPVAPLAAARGGQQKPPRNKGGVFKILSAIAERSFSSHKLDDTICPESTVPECDDLDETCRPLDDLSNSALMLNNNNDNSTHNSNVQLNSPRKFGDAQCSCCDCQAAMMRDTFSDVRSEVSCSLASLPQSPRRNRGVDGIAAGITVRPAVGGGTAAAEMDGVYDQINADGPSAFPPMTGEQDELKPPKTLGDRVQRLSRIWQSTVAAGRKSIGMSDRSGDAPRDSVGSVSRTSPPTGTIRARWSSFRRGFGNRGVNGVPELLSSGHAAQVSPPSRTPSLRSALSLAPFSPLGNNDSPNASLDSIMVVLLSPGSNEVELEQFVRLEPQTSRPQIMVKDPQLKVLLERLKEICMKQVSVITQASKALDECCAQTHKGYKAILFAEKLLHVANHRLCAAEAELHRLVHGGVFEPQRDVLVIRNVTLQLRKDFVESVVHSGKQFIFHVLLKSGHMVESSDLIYISPTERTVVVSKCRERKQTRKASPEGDFVFHFNRPDWKVDIEIYCVYVKNVREATLYLHRLLRKMDIKSPTPPRIHGSQRSVEVRKSSFGLLAHAVVTKHDVVARRPVLLMEGLDTSPLEKELQICGQVQINSTVFFEGYVIVKDFYGRFGFSGQMKTFSGKLTNTRLDFYEVGDSQNEEATPAHTEYLDSLTPDCIQQPESISPYFYDFIIKLADDPVSWLTLCTNSRDDTVLWVSRLTDAVRKPLVLDL